MGEEKDLVVSGPIVAEVLPEYKTKTQLLEEELSRIKDETRKWKIAVSRAVTQAQLQNIIDIVAHIHNPDEPGDYGTPRTDEYYLHPKVGMRRCPCKQDGCRDFWLTGIGHFVQNSGFEEHEARDIVEVLKTLPQYQLKMQNMNDAKRKG